jgi:hypothetical protein
MDIPLFIYADLKSTWPDLPMLSDKNSMDPDIDQGRPELGPSCPLTLGLSIGPQQSEFPTVSLQLPVPSVWLCSEGAACWPSFIKIHDVSSQINGYFHRKSIQFCFCIFSRDKIEIK